ncbi:acyltransferase family protein [Vibrio cyclitrophicus]
MIVFSYILPFYFSEKQAIYSLVPVIGTVLIIVFSKPYGYINRFFSQKIIFYFGLSSYSVYLLHQPILSFLRLSHEGKTPVSSEVFFVLLSIPLGILMWKFIEVPMRNPKKISNKLFYSLILTCILSLSSLGFMMHKSYGFQYASWNSKYSYGVNPQDYADTPYKLQSDSFQTDKPKMLIIGNSFARDFLNVLTESEVTTGYEVVYLFSYYADLTVSRNLASNADVVFFVSSAGKSNRMEDEVDLLERTLKVKVELDNFVAGDYYFVGTKNYGYNNNFTKIFDWDKSKNYLVNINKSSIDANNIQSEIFREKYIDLLSLTRNRDKTRLFTDGHKFISFDTNHITKDGAVYLGGLLLQNEIISEILLKP